MDINLLLDLSNFYDGIANENNNNSTSQETNGQEKKKKRSSSSSKKWREREEEGRRRRRVTELETVGNVLLSGLGYSEHFTGGTTMSTVHAMRLKSLLCEIVSNNEASIMESVYETMLKRLRSYSILSKSKLKKSFPFSLFMETAADAELDRRGLRFGMNKMLAVDWVLVYPLSLGCASSSAAMGHKMETVVRSHLQLRDTFLQMARNHREKRLDSDYSLSGCRCPTSRARSVKMQNSSSLVEVMDGGGDTLVKRPDTILEEEAQTPSLSESLTSSSSSSSCDSKVSDDTTRLPQKRADDACESDCEQSLLIPSCSKNPPQSGDIECEALGESLGGSGEEEELCGMREMNEKLRDIQTNLDTYYTQIEDMLERNRNNLCISMSSTATTASATTAISVSNPGPIGATKAEGDGGNEDGVERQYEAAVQLGDGNANEMENSSKNNKHDTLTPPRISCHMPSPVLVSSSSSSSML